MTITPPSKVQLVYIKGKGRGVICTNPIKKGELIERLPLIILSPEEGDFIKNKSPILKFYALELTSINRHVLHLGYGMIYNHSANPNAELVYTVPNDYIDFVALKEIEIDEEIVYDYSFDGEEEFLPLP